ncbi:hypothetical protein SAMN04489733_0776 [Amycolatopsis keratiniphila]|nr:hypothetical protein SAMN04489733_0776 [Amycolatopsis keratiniphila]
MVTTGVNPPWPKAPLSRWQGAVSTHRDGLLSTSALPTSIAAAGSQTDTMESGVFRG